jgi:hypothetical protein
MTNREQRWVGAVGEFRRGDVVWIPPTEQLWNGASSTTAMTHIAIQKRLGGLAADRMEKASEEQYQARLRAESAKSRDTHRDTQ